ncbi:hypothetical protein GCM10028772_22730 [Nocardioides ultimimeridianus]
MGGPVDVALHAYLKGVSGRRIAFRPIAYPAYAVPTKSSQFWRPAAWRHFLDGLDDGLGDTLDFLRKRSFVCPHEHYILAGYSQGAMIMHRAIWSTLIQTAIGYGRLDGVIAIADGDRYRGGLNYSTARGGEGVGQVFRTAALFNSKAAHKAIPNGLAKRFHSVCDHGDLVCDFSYVIASDPVTDLIRFVHGLRIHSTQYVGQNATFVRVAAANVAKRTMSRSPTLPMTIDDNIVPGTVGKPFVGSFHAHGGSGPYAWSLKAGPPGLSINSSTGALEGLATAEYTLITVQARDHRGQAVDFQEALYAAPARGDGPPAWSTVSGSRRNTTCGIGTDGSGFCWGDNEYGAVGDGTGGYDNNGDPMSVRSPERLPGTWAAIETTGEATCGVQTDDTGWCWGDNRFDAIGNGATGDIVSSPVAIPGQWRSLTTDGMSTCGIRTDDTAWCWGDNSAGQVGNGASGGSVGMATQLSGSWTSLNLQPGPAGAATVCGVQTDGTGWCWGSNYSGQIGNGMSGNVVTTPYKLAGTWLSLEPTEYTTCGIQTDHTGWCWGSDDVGQVGDGSSGVDRVVSSPSPLPGLWSMLDTAGDVDSNFASTCGVQTNGTGWCWGDNTNGKIGNGTSGGIMASPSQVAGSWATISSDWARTCGIQADGTAWCWGANSHGEVGSGTTSPVVTTPAQLPGWWDSLVTGATSCGVRTDNTGWCWGWNTYGSVGDGGTSPAVTPFALPTKPAG